MNKSTKATNTGQCLDFGPVSEKFPHFLHGGDYNPDQWPQEFWHEDMRLMKLANCNAMSVGIFAWSRLEPQEGEFDFDWLDRIMDMLADNDAYAILATPSGARPAWMSHKYPQVLRVGSDRRRNLHGRRHNHCPSSSVYREKTAIINQMLAERYGKHPALLMWHVSNEYGGECHCDLCQRAFRRWLGERYENLEALNQAWWTAFWSHTYSDFSEIESPSPIGENVLHGLNIDWRRFVTDITIDFFEHESSILRATTPEIPITTNLMGFYRLLDYRRMAKHLDIVSWDSYPQWHTPDKPTWQVAADTAFAHDMTRSLKGGRPFMLMESVPSATNWVTHATLKRPKMHRTSSLHAVAHGSDTVQYFQWRKSRGSSEKFHGAVVDHCGHENTRVFKDVAETGETISKLSEIIGSAHPAEAAIIYDWPNRWALDDAMGPKTGVDKDLIGNCLDHYRSLWRLGTGVDVIGSDDCFDKYKLIISPMLYMVSEENARRIEKFVANGGTYVATFLTGIADESDLCYLGGWPGPLRKTLGIWAEEIDSLSPDKSNQLVMNDSNELGINGRFELRDFFDLIHCEKAKTLGSYASDFYAGRPALTVNKLGKGRAFYITSRVEAAFTDAFYEKLADELDLVKAIDTDLPEGVSAAMRSNGKNDFIFLMNFTAQTQSVALDGHQYSDMESGQPTGESITLAAYDSVVLKRSCSWL